MGTATDAGVPSEVRPTAGARALAWWRALPKFPLWLFLSTRIALMASSLIGLQLISTIFFHPETRHEVLKPYPMIEGLCRWDCGWMVHVVEDGYKNAEYAKIFPLFPLLGWLGEKATGIHHIFIFLLVANLASLISYFVIYKMFTELEGEPAARWALIALAAYPFAYFQAAAQPESLMMMITAISLSLAARGKHLWAGGVLGLGVMARHVAIFYGPALLVAQLKQRGIHPKKFLLSPAVLGLALPFVFIGGFSWYLAGKVGDPFAWWNARTIGWGELVWYGARQVITKIPYAMNPEYYYFMVIGLIPWAGSFALLAKKSWHVLAAAALTSMLVFYSGGVATGLGRYTASVWPAFLPIGVWLAARPALQAPVVVAFAMVQGIFFFLFSHQYRVF
jgi:hypothetical protein